ncbi:hypothetical protein GW935_03590 [Candidatus Falkowbacteria bacterium]|nr:hypothetical protein [Candidatus Falkowbacteria bacterium]
MKWLCLTDYIIYPHCRKELQKELGMFKKKTGYPIIELEDEQVCVIDRSVFYYINRDL